MASLIAGSVMKRVVPCLFSTAAISRSAAGIATARTPALWTAINVRFAGTIQASGGDRVEKGGAVVAGSAGGERNEKAVASYWDLSPPKIVKEDGTQWKWSCFRPWDTYSSDLMIDLKKHHVPVTWGDKLARGTVKLLRWPTDIFFQPMMIRTVH